MWLTTAYTLRPIPDSPVADRLDLLYDVVTFPDLRWTFPRTFTPDCLLPHFDCSRLLPLLFDLIVVTRTLIVPLIWRVHSGYPTRTGLHCTALAVCTIAVTVTFFGMVTITVYRLVLFWLLPRWLYVGVTRLVAYVVDLALFVVVDYVTLHSRTLR